MLVQFVLNHSKDYQIVQFWWRLWRHVEPKVEGIDEVWRARETGADRAGRYRELDFMSRYGISNDKALLTLTSLLAARLLSLHAVNGG
jgi:hypothetical protein